MGKAGRRDPPSILPHVVVAKCGCEKTFGSGFARFHSLLIRRDVPCLEVSLHRNDRRAKFVIIFGLDRGVSFDGL